MTTWRPRDDHVTCVKHVVVDIQSDFEKMNSEMALIQTYATCLDTFTETETEKKVRKSKFFCFPRKWFLKSKYLKAQSSLTGSRLKNDRKWAGPLNYTKLGLFEIGCSDLTRTRCHEYFGQDQNDSFAGSYLTNNAYARAFVSVDAGRKQ